MKQQYNKLSIIRLCNLYFLTNILKKIIEVVTVSYYTFLPKLQTQNIGSANTTPFHNH